MSGIPVPEWVIIQSTRYGFGRRSYALPETCDHVRSVWQHLSGGTREVIVRDLEEAIRDSASNMPGDKYGLKVLRDLRADLDRMESAT